MMAGESAIPSLYDIAVWVFHTMVGLVQSIAGLLEGWIPTNVAIILILVIVVVVSRAKMNSIIFWGLLLVAMFLFLSGTIPLPMFGITGS